jgi:hypothetical protein
VTALGHHDLPIQNPPFHDACFGIFVMMILDGLTNTGRGIAMFPSAMAEGVYMTGYFCNIDGVLKKDK